MSLRRKWRCQADTPTQHSDPTPHAPPAAKADGPGLVVGNVAHYSGFLRGALRLGIQKGKKRQGGGLAVGIWTRVFLPLASYLFSLLLLPVPEAAPHVAQRLQSPSFPTVPALHGGGDWRDRQGSPTRAGPALGQLHGPGRLLPQTQLCSQDFVLPFPSPLSHANLSPTPNAPFPLSPWS